MSELKKCPFCGGEAVIQKINDSTLSFAVCVECRMRTPTLQDGKIAMRAWNRRKPMDNIVEKLEEESKKKHNKERDVLCKIANASYSAGVEYAINIVKQEINNGLE